MCYFVRQLSADMEYFKALHHKIFDSSLGHPPLLAPQFGLSYQMDVLPNSQPIAQTSVAPFLNRINRLPGQLMDYLMLGSLVFIRTRKAFWGLTGMLNMDMIT